MLYFESSLSHSPAGKRLATTIAERLDLPIAGRTVPILKDTRSPAVVIATEPLDGKTGGAAAQGLIDLFAEELDEQQS